MQMVDVYNVMLAQDGAAGLPNEAAPVTSDPAGAPGGC